MSFRKRGEVLGGNSSRNVPGKNSIDALDSRRGPAPLRTPLPNRAVPDRKGINAPAGTTVSSVAMGMRNITLNDKFLQTLSTLDPSHPGVRPSPATSQQTTSTGCHDLDKLLGHMGLPLGQSLLIEEQGTTDFSSILMKVFASQGILHNRSEGSTAGTNGNTHLVMLTLNQQFAKELPGIYKGSRKEIKKSKISEEESKLTVQNMLENQTQQRAQPTRYQDLKIAWRYGLTDEKKRSGKRDEPENETYPDYNHQFDITTRLVPAPTSTEISFVSPLQPVQSVLLQLEAIIKKQDKKLIRILIPGLLHPAMYPPKYSQLSVIVPLLHGIRSLVKKYGDRCVLLSTISSDLYAASNALFVPTIENLFDSVLNLEPFHQDMVQLLERAYKSQPNKVQHGLVHVLKLPVLSDRGEMHVMKSEWAFRNGKKRFEIEEWGIPVDDDGDDDNKRGKHDPHGHDPHGHKKQHTKSLDF